MNEWIKTVVYTHTVQQYSVIKKETIPFVTTQMNLEHTMLSEISQTEKEKHCMSSFT